MAKSVTSLDEFVGKGVKDGEIREFVKVIKSRKTTLFDGPTLSRPIDEDSTKWTVVILAPPTLCAI